MRWNILKRRDQWQETPLRVREHLRKEFAARSLRLPSGAVQVFNALHNLIIADNEVACKAAERSFEERKMPCTILSTSAELGARDMGRLLAAFAAKMKPSSRIHMPHGAILIGGECSVQVTGNGKGGRNQVVALSAVEEIEGLEGTVIAALGTDGIDGNSSAAGAIVDGNTARRPN